MRPNKPFCPNCGAQLAPVPQPPVQNPYAEAGTQRAAEPTQFATPNGGQGIPSLEIEFNHGGKSTYDLTKPVINIGRDPSNDIVIDTPVVSHFHAQIVREGNQLILVHPHPSQPHTTNGLLYQGRHILGNEPFRKPLVRGDIFRIGDEHGTLVTLTYHDGGRAPQDIVPQIRPLLVAPSLEIEFNHGGKSTYDLTKPVINIGRDPSNDIVIDTPVVSHFHAQIVREGNQLILVHPHPSQPHTTNGLLYQGRHILGNEPFRKPLVRGDIFRIGDEHGTLVTLTYHDGSGAPQDIVPQIRPLPLGAPVITLGSQPQPPQPQGKQQEQAHHQRSQPKKPRASSTQVKVARISALSAIAIAIITAILAPVIIRHFAGEGQPPTPTPTSSIPHLHSSYTGSYSVTRTNWSVLLDGPIIFSSIAEDDQGQMQLTMALSSGYYQCQGSVNTSSSLFLSCTKVGEMNLQVVVKGHVSQDESRLSGTWSASDPTRPSLYEDATWSAQ